MWEFQHSVETEKSPAALWRLYSDVSTWPMWDPTIEQVELEGPFVAGATGRMKPVGQDAMAFSITRCVPGEGFDSESALGPVTVRFQHDLEPLPSGGTRLVHGVTISGPAADQMGPQVGPMITADIPGAMMKLVELA